MNIKHLKYIVFLLALFLVTSVITACSSTNQATKGNSTTSPDGQIIKLYSDDSGQFAPREIRVKLGSKVKIEGNIDTLIGGMDTVIIEGYDIRKKISSNDNIIEFTANKPGTFKMYCANGKGNGKLVVMP